MRTTRYCNGLEVISTTGKSLISFVESYRKFTHIPTPEPTLFYVQKFVERMVKLARHHTNFPNITITVSVEPSDLIVYADENLISQVVLNLLKNAMQAIGSEQENGLIEVNAYCNEEEAVLIEVSNNGPVIPQEEAEHIFVPFFTTKEGGSGIGLSISRPDHAPFGRQYRPEECAGSQTDDIRIDIPLIN